MAASALYPDKQGEHTTHGLRPVRIRNDLGKVADLIEVAFGPKMDSGGRAAVREMRALSRSGPLLWVLAGLDSAVQALTRGFVWIEPSSGNLIGNVSIYPAGHDNVWVIANVAVHPEFRRQGIAKELMLASLDLSVQQKASAVVLQVESDNDNALQLYRELGFRELRAFTRWRRRPYMEPPLRQDTTAQITFRSYREWRAEYAMALHLRPNAQGGMGWLRPTKPDEFRDSLLSGASSVLGLKNIQRWVIRGEKHPVLATMRTETNFGSSYAKVDILVHPEQQGHLEWTLLNYITRYFADRRRGLLLDHPKDDAAANQVFYEYRFESVRHLTHMEWTPPK